MESIIYKPLYQKAMNLASDLKQEVEKRTEGKDLKINDAIYKWEFALALYDFLSGDISKEELKEFINSRLLLLELNPPEPL